MHEDELVHHYPLLYHMAARGSWPSIRDAGLLPTQRLLDRCAAGPDVRDAVLGRRRERSVVLADPELGDVVIRDQSPLRERHLVASLTDMTVQQWLDVLNDRVFFWLHPARLEVLLHARRYRDREHDVLVVDTARLLAAHRDRVRLSALNSGATLYPNAPPRGTGTFRTVGDYPWRPRRRRGPVGPAGGIAELAVVGGVPDVADHVVRVERRRRGELVAVLAGPPDPPAP